MHDLERAVDLLKTRFPGPGGACAVLRAGAVVARHAWGFANLEQRIPFTPETLFRLCSITKQFTTAALLDAFPDPAALDRDVARHLPLMEAPPPTATLCHNQSGLRDYWAEAMLHGSPAEGPFGEREASRVIGGMRTLQFAPGTRYSYTNQNFRILADVLAERTGRSFAENLRARLFGPAGMATAFLAADTRAMPDGTEGYEGSTETGFRPAVNRIAWTGDAALGASLDDMIAWELFIDRTREDPAGLYNRLSAPVRFSDGADAGYGFGLARGQKFGRAVTGHGGALRGWRSHRIHCAAERLSVVVMFNHLSDAAAAASSLLQAALGFTAEAQPVLPVPDWAGAFIEPETGLAARVEAGPPGQVRLRYDRFPELLTMRADGTASSEGARLRQEADGLWMDRAIDHQSSRLLPRAPLQHMDVAGRFCCAELDAELTVVDAGGAIHGAFAGFLGPGRMERLQPVADDLWALPCPRALDHTPPGDWTLAFERGDDGRVTAVQVGCWLARGLRYERAG